MLTGHRAWVILSGDVWSRVGEFYLPARSVGWTHWPRKVQISGDMQEPSCIPPTCAGVAEYSFPNLTVQGLKAQAPPRHP